MRTSSSTGMTFVNAQTYGSGAFALRIEGSRIAAVGGRPCSGDLVVDLQGDRVLPGLINAHDHLQLNSLPKLDSGNRYDHVQDWISEINARRRSDPSFEASITVPRDERLLIGGLKNLLSGVTTVAHHDPLYSFLLNADFPSAVVNDYGWAHSLYMDGEEKVRASYENTPPEWPWIIHAAEGANQEAASEFDRLDALGCIGPNALLVHGIALDAAQRRRLISASAGLIWCPSSNLRLFGRTAEVTDLLAQGRIGLGTDSRLSGSRDLLDELRLIADLYALDEFSLQSLVTRDNARLLRLADRGSLQPGTRADILILPARIQLSKAARADVRLVLRNGIALYGDQDCARSVAPGVDWIDICVDGNPKVLNSRVATLLKNSNLPENGLEFTDAVWRAA